MTQFPVRNRHSQSGPPSADSSSLPGRFSQFAGAGQVVSMDVGFGDGRCEAVPVSFLG